MQPTRREILAGAGMMLGANAQPGAPRPNILWMIAEDFSPDLGCYGNKLVRTPNLDSLAARGVRFSRAFVTAPVCSASRSAIAVGMYQTTVGGHQHRSHRDDGYRLPEGVHVFTHYLRQAGYFTANVRNARGLQGTGKTDFNYSTEPPFEGDEWTGRKPGQPFYAQINVSETHRGFRRHPSRPVDPDKVKLPAFYPDHPAIRLDWAMYLDTAQHLDDKIGRVLKQLETDGLADDTIVIFFSDHGQPMPRGKQFLYEAGIRIPLIVYVPPKFRVPGYRPGTVEDGMVSSIDITATTLHLAGIPLPKHLQGQPFLGDGARTRDVIFAARDRCDETVDRIRCVRDARFKYIRNYYPERPYTQQNVYKDRAYSPLRVLRDLNEQGKLTGAAAAFLANRRPPEELYDLVADPDEIHNLAAQPAHAAKLRAMRARLDQWVRETRDQGETPEKDIPSWDKGRQEVDGWLTDTGNLTRRGGVLYAQFTGDERPATLGRSIVAPAGSFLFEFRARTGGLLPSALTWWQVDSIRNPEFEKKFESRPDGDSRIYSARFTTSNWLSLATIVMQNSQGTIEIDWIRLSRIEGGEAKPAAEWAF